MRVETDRVVIATADRVGVEFDVAGVGSRLIAQMIDIALLGAAALAILLVGALAGAGGASGGALLALTIVTVGALPLGYFVVCEWRFGRTLGKRALRIRILTKAGARIGLREALTRNVLRLVDWLPVGYALGGLVAVVSPRAQRLGDIVAGTIAVREPRTPGAIRGAAAPSFTEQAAGLERDGHALPPGVADLVAEFRDRRLALTPLARVTLARELAVKVERYWPREPGTPDEVFLASALAGTSPDERSPG